MVTCLRRARLTRQALEEHTDSYGDPRVLNKEFVSKYVKKQQKLFSFPITDADNVQSVKANNEDNKDSLSSDSFVTARSQQKIPLTDENTNKMMNDPSNKNPSRKSDTEETMSGHSRHSIEHGFPSLKGSLLISRSNMREKNSRSPLDRKAKKLSSCHSQHPSQDRTRRSKLEFRDLTSRENIKKTDHVRMDTDLAPKNERAGKKSRIQKRKRCQKNKSLLASSQIMQKFSSCKLGTNRVTVRTDIKPGIFNKGKASEKIVTKGVPDLVFSEIDFLNSVPSKKRKNNKDDASKIKNSNIRRDRRKTDQPFSHLHDDRRSGQDSKTSSSGGSRSHSNGKLSAKRYKDVTKRSNKSSAVCHRCGSDKVSSSFSKAEPPLSSHRCDNISVKYLPREGNRVSSTVNSPERPYNPFSSQKSICDSPALVNKTSVSRTCLNDEDSFSTKDQIIESPYFAYDKKHNCLFDDLPQDSDDRTISSSGHLDSCGSKSNPNLHSRISGTYELFSKYWPPKELHGLRESGHDNIQDNRNGDINGNNFLIDEGRQDKNECAEETNRYLNRGEKNSEIQLDNCESSTMKKYGDPASDKSLNNPVLTFEKSWNDKHAVREVNIMKPDYIVSSPYSISEGYDVEKSVTIDWSEIDGDDAGGNDGESLVDLFGRSSPFSFTDGRSTFDVNEDLVSTFVWRRHRLH